MKNANYFLRFSFWVGTLAILGLFLLALPNSDTLAAPAKRNVSFDHVKTGFPLTGAHVTLPCETCHVNGTFKGTPKKCATCHARGSRIQTTTVKPSNHIPTTQACEQCHTSTASWGVAFFSHAGVIAHQCGQCHNSSVAKGKPAKHTPTNAPCDTCHRTTTWMSASFTHVSVMPGSCASCHILGGSGLAKPSNHVPTNLACDACHTTGGSFTTSRFTHSATQGIVAGQCATCHNGSHTQWNALGKSSGHVVTTASCDTCHTGYASFAISGSTFNHTGVSPGTCATCHFQGGSAKTFKPTNHIPTVLSCDACHTTGGTFTTSRFTHSATQGVITGQCSTCHNGSYTQWNALGKPSNHVITSASCDTCHTGYVTFAGLSSTAFNHTGVNPGTCTTCHFQGGSATAKPTDHIPTNLSCDACHTTGGTFTTSRFTHSATQGITAGQCSTCHNGSYTKWNVLSKPSNHIPTTTSCDACHTTGGTFTTSTFTHSATQGVITGQCATCHNGSYTQWNALGKPSGHVATTASCDTCHKGYASFSGAAFNHTGVSPGTCSTCHYQGGSGLAKPTNHIPYESQLLAGSSMNCDSCHKSTTSFATQTMNHNNSLGSGAGSCKGCHQSGTNYLGTMQKKALNHYERYAGQTDCSASGCHKPLGNQGTAYSRWTN